MSSALESSSSEQPQGDSQAREHHGHEHRHHHGSGRRRRRHRSSSSSSTHSHSRRESHDAPSSKFDTVIEWLLMAMLAFMPLAFGAVDAWAEMIVVALTIAITVVFAAKLIFSRSATLIWTWLYVPIALFIGVVALQLMPLPIEWIKVLSPQTVAFKSELLAYTPGALDSGKMTLTFYGWETSRMLRLLLCVSAVFVVVLNTIRRTSQIKRLLSAIAVVAAFVAIIQISQVISGTTRIYGVFPMAHKNSATFANHSNFGQYMNLALGAMLALLLLQLDSLRGNEAGRLSLTKFNEPGVRFTLLLIATLAAGSAALFLSLTRGGMGGWLVGGLVAGFILARSRDGSNKLRLLLIPLLIGGAVLLFVGFDLVHSRLATLGELHSEERELDWARWTISVDIIQSVLPAYPWFGVGLGNHEIFYPSVQTLAHERVAGHADNDYAELLLEVGVVGSGLVFVFLVGVVANAIRCVRKGDTTTRSIAIGMVFGLAAILVGSATDFGQRVPACAVLTAIACALLIGLAHRSRSLAQHQPQLEGDVSADRADPEEAVSQASHRGTPVLVRIPAGLVTLLIAISVGAWSLLEAQHAAAGEKHWRSVLRTDTQLRKVKWIGTNDQYKQILVDSEAAVAADPTNVRYRHFLNVYRWQSMNRVRDAETGQALLSSRALDVAARVVQDLRLERTLCPTFAPSFAMAGQLGYYALAQPDPARDEIRLAYRLAASEPASVAAYAALEAREQHFENAVELFRQLVQIHNRYQADANGIFIDELKRVDLAVSVAGDHAGRLDSVYQHLSRLKLENEIALLRPTLLAVLEKESQQPDVPAYRLQRLAQLYEQDGRPLDAVATWRRVLAREYKYGYRIALARALQKAGDLENALIEAKGSLRMKPDSLEAQKLVESLSVAPRRRPGVSQ